MVLLNREELFTRLDRDIAAFAGVLDGTDLASDVPSCPGWSLADLTRHLGSTHRWATDVVQTGQLSDDSVEVTIDGPDLGRWFADGAAALVQTLHDVPADRPCWTFGPPREAGFWLRRQVHETSVHRWDAQAAAETVGVIDHALATDGVDEVVTIFYPRQVRLGRQSPLTQTVELRTLDTDQRWNLGENGSSVARLSASASDLLLLLWRRVRLDEVAADVEGQRDAVTTMLAAAITP